MGGAGVDLGFSGLGFFALFLACGLGLGHGNLKGR